MSELRVIIAGGGTGGHIFPAVAVGQALLRLQPGTQLLFVGARGKMEMEKVPREGFEIIGLDIVGYNRNNLWKNISLPLKLLKSRIQAWGIIRRFNPGVIVGVGGYASFPVLNAGQVMNIPTLVQEQNSYAGKSNKILGRRAKAICVAYPNMEQFFPKDKITMTGNPVRKSISLMSKTGEEGNECVYALLDEMLIEDVNIIWQTGKPYHEQAKNRVAEVNNRVKVFDFITDMDYAYAAADIVISRAGALAIAELCIAGKPVIFVPFPAAAEDHQASNAMALVNNEAALMVKDHEMKTELLKNLITLLHDGAMQEKMSENLKAMAIKDADERIAKKVMEIAMMS
jgi:UDP-N-acetylglucosamine--N-acetylmuramyl-(pentapeptide) pyrophosphoryl-undecaprenol N-acetylglucosamine transferase